MKEKPILTDEIFWQIADSDDGSGDKQFREGKGFDALCAELKRRIEAEPERTPEGFVPSANIGIYWNTVVDHWEPVEEPASA